MADLSRTLSKKADRYMVGASTTPVEVIDLNSEDAPNIEGYILYNYSDTDCMICFGDADNTGSGDFSFVIPAGGFYESPALETFIGRIQAFWEEANMNGLLVTLKRS